MAQHAVDVLVGRLEEHGFSASRKDLESAIARETPPSVEWITEYLENETVLTKGELALYTSLEKSGVVEVLADSRDGLSMRTFDDQDLRTAIQDLDTSTTAIEEQMATLKSQREAMSSFTRSTMRHSESRKTINNAQHRAWATEFQNSSSTVNETSQNLRVIANELEAERETINSRLVSTASQILRSDDKLLMSLQKLASDLELERPEKDDITGRIRELCARLIKHTVEGVRTRLDKIYLESVNGLPDHLNADLMENPEVTALRAELESLYSEILPVAQMSAEQQYLQPALQIIEAEDLRGQSRSYKALAYISSCLSHLIAGLSAYSNRAEEYQSHCYATKSLLTVIQKETSVPLPIFPSKAKSSVIGGGTSTHRKNSKTSPIRSRAVHRRRSSASSINDEDTASAEQLLLRNLGISLPAPGLFSAAEANAAAINALEDVLAERMMKVAVQAQSVQEGAEAAFTGHAQDADLSLRLLRESLLSETSGGHVRLMDMEVEEAIQHLKTEVQEVQKAVGAVILEGVGERNTRRDKLTERWRR